VSDWNALCILLVLLKRPQHLVLGQTIANTFPSSTLYSWVIITLAKQTVALEANPDKPALMSTPHTFEAQSWKRTCRSEAIRISELLEGMRQTWGADHFPVIIMQPATIAAFTLLEDLDNRPESQRAFYKLCIVLRAASRRFRVNRGILRLLERTAKEKYITLPEGCSELLADFTTTMEVDDDAIRFDDLGLDYLLEKWDDLGLDEAL
jgi:hypothetical protein